jgi:protein arginine N-methyltransferase 1
MGSSRGGPPGPSGMAAPSAKGSTVDKAADFANYFCTYAFLYHQKEMLSDRVRMDAYYQSIFRNARHFAGKVCHLNRDVLSLHHGDVNV